MRRALTWLAITVLLGVAAAPAARAELVVEFDVALKDFKPAYDGYTTVLNGRAYDTTGAPAPLLQSAQIRLPRGATIRSTYVYGKFLCDTVSLSVTLNPGACRGSQFATGTMVLDARPDIADPISASIYLFLGVPSTDEVPRGAAAKVVVYVVGTNAFQSQVLYGTLFHDSGLYSYRLVLPTSITPSKPGLRLSLAELHLTSTGLVLQKPATERRSARKIFWTSLPRCTKQRKIFFEIDYQFADAAPIAKQRSLKCSKFLRRRSLQGKGGV